MRSARLTSREVNQVFARCAGKMVQRAHPGAGAGVPAGVAPDDWEPLVFADCFRLAMPFPPTVNHYYHRKGASVVQVDGVEVQRTRGGVFLDARAKGFRETVGKLLLAHRTPTLYGRLRLEVTVYQPDDKRKYDLSNTLKALEDALQAGGAFPDDEAIDDERITRGPRWGLGCVLVTVDELQPKG